MTGPVQVIRIDDGDAPSVVYVPTPSSSGVSEERLATVLQPYATKLYVDSVISGETPAAVQERIDTAIAAHRNDTTPHPAYDAMRSLTLLFENRLV